MVDLPDELVDLSLMDIMDQWPQTIGVFMKNQMLCVGCTIAPFHTVTDACREHDLDENDIWTELAIAINAP